MEYNNIEGIQTLSISEKHNNEEKNESNCASSECSDELKKDMLKDNYTIEGKKFDNVGACDKSDTLVTSNEISKVIEFEKKEKEKQKKEDNQHQVIGHHKLYSWLNKNMKIEMTDGRILIGVFLCTDRDGNVILGSCSEYINPEVCGFNDEPRILGLVMVPGRHIVSIHHDAGTPQNLDQEQTKL